MVSMLGQSSDPVTHAGDSTGCDCQRESIATSDHRKDAANHDSGNSDREMESVLR